MLCCLASPPCESLFSFFLPIFMPITFCFFSLVLNAMLKVCSGLGRAERERWETQRLRKQVLSEFFTSFLLLTSALCSFLLCSLCPWDCWPEWLCSCPGTQ